MKVQDEAGIYKAIYLCGVSVSTSISSISCTPGAAQSACCAAS